MTSSSPRFPSASHHGSVVSYKTDSIRDHDHHGPAGPTAFWKVSNEIDNSLVDDPDDADDEGDADYEEGVDEDEVGEEEIDIANLNVEQIIAVLSAIGGS